MSSAKTMTTFGRDWSAANDQLTEAQTPSTARRGRIIGSSEVKALAAAGRQQDAEFRPGAEGDHDRLLLPPVHVADGPGDGELADLHEPLLGHPLGPVVGERVRDLMTHDGGEGAFRPRHRKDPRVDDD